MAAAIIAALGSAAAEYARSRAQQQQNAGPRFGKIVNPANGLALRVASPGADPLIGAGSGAQGNPNVRLMALTEGGGAQELRMDTGTFGMNLGGPYGLTTNRTASSTSGRAATSTRGGLPVFTNGVTVRRRHRRMNITNVKALRRAERRVGGFVKLARKFVTFHTSHKLKHHRRRR
jgi:hypothetical protein